ncbi:MAG: hypothetical protein EZS28_015143 [Streblomastix strix]|uniref:Uncharacterized protein n=1 Tax=Streblomastix strix TaxID=222440 RepID=A0A5J4W322_9EUKA|nr:MAG: hypothetical protein EZS28_015143 [Streblomastix strix]
MYGWLINKQFEYFLSKQIETDSKKGGPGTNIPQIIEQFEGVGSDSSFSPSPRNVEFENAKSDEKFEQDKSNIRKASLRFARADAEFQFKKSSIYDLFPAQLWKHFSELNNIPRESRKTELQNIIQYR